MKSTQPHFIRRVLVWPLWPLLVLGLGLALTYSLWRGAEEKAWLALDAEFQAQSNEVASHVQNRLQANIQVLRGVAALFDASAEVDRQEFRTYVEALHLEERYPGILGVGFSLRLAPEALASHITAIQREGFADYRVKPEGVRDSYSAIIYLEPFSGRNLRAFGFDMYSEPVRRAAMERACDSDSATMSGKVTLMQETTADVQSGFLLYVPVYRHGQPHASVAERQANLLGWAYSPLRMRDMMQAMLSVADFVGLTAAIDVEIYDGARPTAEGLMYDSDQITSLGTPEGQFRSLRAIEAGGQRWTLQMTSRPAFDARLARGKSSLIAFAGILVSLSISLLLGVMTFSQRRVLAALEKAAQANRELAESEAKYRLVTDNAMEWVFWNAPDGSALYNSPSCAQICGYDPAALSADPGLFLRLIHPDDRPNYLAHLSPQGDRTPHSALDDLEFRIRHGDGSERWIAHACRAIFDADGRYLGNRGSNRDITERKCLQAELDHYRQHLEALVASRTLELNQALVQAEAGNRAKSQFLANMGHELRTPINAIIGMAHLAQQASSEPAVMEKMQHVRDAANHLLGIINDVLDLARLESGQLLLDTSLFSFEDLIETAVSRARTAATAKGLLLGSEIDPELQGDYRGDPGRLAQVLNNFLSNAVKFTEHGHVTLRASLQAGEPDAKRVQVRFEIEDTGIGISASDQARLFQPFTQIDASSTRKHGGSGLGLAINRHLVRMMGGELGVRSAPHQGSTFWFVCQLEKLAITSSAMPEDAQSAPDPTALRVALDGDDIAALDELESLLAADDMRATAALNALRSRLLGVVDAAALARLSREIEMFNFPTALEILRRDIRKAVSGGDTEAI